MKTSLVVVSAAAAAAVMAAGGFAGASFLSGGGTQPEDILPAATIAFAKADLDPGAGQKINLLRLAKKFPSVEIDGDDLKSTVGKALLDGNDLGLSYATDIEPWMGNRIAIAAVAVPGSDDGFAPVVAIEFTDEAQMTATLDKAKKNADETLAFAIRDDFVLVSDSQEEVDSFVSGSTLADQDTFSADRDSIDGDDQIVLGWVDIAGAYDAVPAQDKKDFAESLGSAEPAGSVVFGVSAESDHLEATGKSRDVTVSGVGTNKIGSTPGTGMAFDFPADASAAVSITQLGPVAVDVWNKFGGKPDLGLVGAAESMGLDLPADLEAILGTDLAAYLEIGDGLDGEGAVRVKTANPDRAIEVLSRVLSGESGSVGAEISPAEGGYLIGYKLAAAGEVTDGENGLGDNPEFEKAVKDGRDANALLYVNIADVVDSLSSNPGMFGDEETLSNLKPLEAFGFSSTGSAANGEFTARLTVR